MAESTPGVVLDASAAIALLRDEPGADVVEELLRSAPARMSTVNVAETVDILVRCHGGELDEVAASVEQLVASVVSTVPPSLVLAVRAGELRARYFDRRNRRVSLADCFVLATATEGDTIVTSDGVLADAAREQGFAVVALAEAVS